MSSHSYEIFTLFSFFFLYLYRSGKLCPFKIKIVAKIDNNEDLTKRQSWLELTHHSTANDHNHDILGVDEGRQQEVDVEGYYYTIF